MVSYYDKENDILYFHVDKPSTDFCMELFDGRIVLDFDKKNEIVGIEIFDFMEQVKRHNKKFNSLMKKK